MKCFGHFFAAAPLSVSIIGSPDPRIHRVYQAGTKVRLECITNFDAGYFSYQWSSTCTGNCFILQQTTRPIVERDILHAVDSGSHTCTVTDDIGNTANATITMTVSGKLSYLCTCN